jgi:hypothetical protein
MKILITESQLNFIRRLPAIEEELNKVLRFVEPLIFSDFQNYIVYELRNEIRKIYNSKKPGSLF